MKPPHNLKVTNEQIMEAVAQYGSARAAAKALGVNKKTVLLRVRNHSLPVTIPKKSERFEPLSKPYEVASLPEDDIPIEQLVELRKRQFRHKRDYEEASKLIPVQVKLRGPIGLLHFGDPHVDDDGTDIEALERHTDLCRVTEGMFACNVGDTTNNWVGRLAKLYAEQSTSASQAWKLAEWFIKRCDWLYMIAGNHDAWSGSADPIKWIAKQQGTLYKSSEARLELNFPCGKKVRVNARHDFAGSSIWNPAHGPMKAAMLGSRDHIFVAGHKHESAYSVIKDPQHGITMHAIKVASYKIYDRYAKERGFRDNALSPCVVTVINPNLPETHPDMVKVFWEPEVAAEYLTWLRARR
jgi:hypothetical protein